MFYFVLNFIVLPHKNVLGKKLIFKSACHGFVEGEKRRQWKIYFLHFRLLFKLEKMLLLN